jgi:hypothetical protein
MYFTVNQIQRTWLCLFFLATGAFLRADDDYPQLLVAVDISKSDGVNAFQAAREVRSAIPGVMFKDRKVEVVFFADKVYEPSDVMASPDGADKTLRYYADEYDKVIKNHCTGNPEPAFPPNETAATGICWTDFQPLFEYIGQFVHKHHSTHPFVWILSDGIQQIKGSPANTPLIPWATLGSLLNLNADAEWSLFLIPPQGKIDKATRANWTQPDAYKHCPHFASLEGTRSQHIQQLSHSLDQHANNRIAATHFYCGYSVRSDNNVPQLIFGGTVQSRYDTEISLSFNVENFDPPVKDISTISLSTLVIPPKQTRPWYGQADLPLDFLAPSATLYVHVDNPNPQQWVEVVPVPIVCEPANVPKVVHLIEYHGFNVTSGSPQITAQVNSVYETKDSRRGHPADLEVEVRATPPTEGVSEFDCRSSNGTPIESGRSHINGRQGFVCSPQTTFSLPLIPKYFHSGLDFYYPGGGKAPLFSKSGEDLSAERWAAVSLGYIGAIVIAFHGLWWLGWFCVRWIAVKLKNTVSTTVAASNTRRARLGKKFASLLVSLPERMDQGLLGWFAAWAVACLLLAGLVIQQEGQSFFFLLGVDSYFKWFFVIYFSAVAIGAAFVARERKELPHHGLAFVANLFSAFIVALFLGLWAGLVLPLVRGVVLGFVSRAGLGDFFWILLTFPNVAFSHHTPSPAPPLHDPPGQPHPQNPSSKGATVGGRP